MALRDRDYEHQAGVECTAHTDSAQAVHYSGTYLARPRHHDDRSVTAKQDSLARQEASGTLLHLPRSWWPAGPSRRGGSARAQTLENKPYMDSLIAKANTTLPKSIRVSTERKKTLLRDAELLLPNSVGRMEMEGGTDRSWRISQDEIVNSIGIEAARGRKEFTLDGGPYRARYTRNGRHMAVVGQKGHIATFDWQTGTILSELQLQETCRDITYVLP